VTVVPETELPDQADVIVVGGGHNGLACAAYLARAGRSVVVLEARETVGGCASTVPAIGARVNICNCDHTMILASGVLEELDLAGVGLRYLDVDPMMIGVGWAGEPAFVQWRSTERTVDVLGRVDPAWAAAYRRYLAAALPAARLVLAAQRARVGTRSIAAAAGRRGGRGGATILRWSRRSLRQVLGSFGLPDHVIAAAATIGPAVTGNGPDAPGTGLMAIGLAVRHLVGVGRPAGGSGALPDALAARLRASGGTIVTGARVSGLDVQADRVRGVRLADGRAVTATTVISSLDPRTVLVDWLDGVPAAASSRAWAAAARPRGDGYESKLDAVIGVLPSFPAVEALGDDVLAAAARSVATVVVSPTLEQQAAAVAARAGGLVRDPPMYLLNVPSVLDPSMRPSEHAHLLSLEVLWTPYELRGGWDGSDEPFGWLRRLPATNTDKVVASVRDWRVVTPPDYEREFSLARGYAPSFPGGVVDALLGRHRELSRYRSPVPGLYLTGAGTFPGAGVWGASGRNTAAAVLAAR
jgi:phytoene dehydrogenase-like protein